MPRTAPHRWLTPPRWCGTGRKGELCAARRTRLARSSPPSGVEQRTGGYPTGRSTSREAPSSQGQEDALVVDSRQRSLGPDRTKGFGLRDGKSSNLRFRGRDGRTGSAERAVESCTPGEQSCGRVRGEGLGPLSSSSRPVEVQACQDFQRCSGITVAIVERARKPKGASGRTSGHTGVRQRTRPWNHDSMPESLEVGETAS